VVIEFCDREYKTVKSDSDGDCDCDNDREAADEQFSYVEIMIIQIWASQSMRPFCRRSNDGIESFVLF